MSMLSDFQTEFLSTVFQPDQESSDLFCNNALLNTQRLGTEEQLNIYTQGIYNGLINTLSDIYPVCKKLTGEPFFYAMAKQYIQQHPSRSPDLAEFGNQFSIFISHFSAADSVPYLSDITKLEWAYHRAFHAQNQPLFDLNQISQYSAEQLTSCIFSLPDGYFLLESLYPVDRIWTTNQMDEEVNLEIEITTGYFYLYRKEYEIHIDKITPHEWLFLQATTKKNEFVKICDDLSNVISDDINVSELLVRSLQNGWINHAQLQDD